MTVWDKRCLSALIGSNIIITSGLALCLTWFLIARNFDFLLPKNAGFVLFPLSHLSDEELLWISFFSSENDNVCSF